MPISMRPVGLKNVTLTEGFWKKRQDINRKVTLPLELEQCRRTGRLDAFKLQWKSGEPNRPHNFWDSDIAKWIEAAAYSIAKVPDPELEREVDGAIDLIASAQRPDGYLNVWYSVVEPGKRWTNLRDMHELYCAGHLMEAATAYYDATGKRKLLDCLCRYADHIADQFGPGEGQKRGYCGHPEIELALVKLARATGNDRYAKLAEFFVTERGQEPNYFLKEAQERQEKGKPWAALDYYQAHAPLTEQKTLEGHAVRALYLLAGAIDVAASAGNKKLWKACKRLFDNCVNQRMYITGAVGSARHGERFTYDYDLPNETAYAETCANIALALAAHRMLHVEPNGRYADLMERTLYNGVVSGVSLKGDRFFYANPLTIADEALKTEWGVISAKRQEWFDCACCPPNIARLLGEVNELFYSIAHSTLFVHLYGSNVATAEVDGVKVGIEQRTQYPWNGDIELMLAPEIPTTFALKLRIPGWCAKWSVSVNGRKHKAEVRDGYASVHREWSAGDKVILQLEMAVQMMETNPHSRNNAGKVAVQRGPIVFCAEEIDNGSDLSDLVIPANAKWKATREPRLLGDCVTLSTSALRETNDFGDKLYRPIGKTKLRRDTLTLVPYCVWGNRKVGRMQVWLRAAK